MPSKGRSKSAGEEERYFLPDTPVESERDDAFAHTAQVAALEEIVTTCPTPFCVGVFGKWGAGKSGVARRLAAIVDERPRCRALVFDAWKYVGNSFRRQFLIECDEGLRAGLDYRTELARTISKTVERSISVKWLPLLVHLGLILVLWLGFWFLLEKQKVALVWADQTLTIVAVFAVAVVVAHDIAGHIRVTPDQFVYPRPDSPEQFRSKFLDVLSQLRAGREKVDRFVFVIDNLDRCHSELVLEVLSALKTFLDCEGCVFVVPCDDEALRCHVQRALDSEDPREFMRKLFNAAIRLHNPIEDELSGYIATLCEQTALPVEHDGRLVLFQAATLFRNPRLVKSILNSSAADFLLARSLEARGWLRPRAVTGNAAFLLKNSVIREQWPWFHTAALGNYRLLNQATGQAVQLGSSSGGDEAFRKQFESIIPTDTPVDAQSANLLRLFLVATRMVTAANIEDFLRFKSTPDEAMIPDREEFRDALLTGQVREIARSLQAAVEISLDELSRYWRFAANKLQLEVMQQNFSVATVGTDALATAVVGIPELLTSERADELVVLVAQTPVSENFRHFNPEVLLRVCRQAPQSDGRTFIVHNLLPQTAESDPFPARRFVLLVEYRDLWGTADQAFMRRLPVTRYEKDESSILEVLEGLSDQDYAAVSSEELFEKTVSLVASTPLDDPSRRRLALAARTLAHITSTKRLAFAGLLRDIITYPGLGDPTWTEQRKLGLSLLAGLGDEHLPEGFTDLLAEPLLQLLQASPELGSRLAIWETLLRKRATLGDSTTASLRNATVRMMQQGGAVAVSALLARLGEIAPTEPLCQAILDSAAEFVRANRDAAILDQFSRALPPTECHREVGLLTDLLATGEVPVAQMAVTAAMGRSAELAETQTSALTEAAYEKALSVPVEQRTLYLDFIFDFPHSAPSLRARVANELTGWLLGPEHALAALACDHLCRHREALTPDDRRILATRMADWLGEQTADAMRKEVWDTVLCYREDLHSGSMIELTEAIAKLLRSPDASHVERGVAYTDAIRPLLSTTDAIRLVTGLSAVIDKPGVDPRRILESMRALARRDSWEQAAVDNARDRLRILVESVQDEPTKAWAEEEAARFPLPHQPPGES